MKNLNTQLTQAITESALDIEQPTGNTRLTCANVQHVLDFVAQGHVFHAPGLSWRRGAPPDIIYNTW